MIAGFVWAAVSLVLVIFTKKYYLPYLVNKTISAETNAVEKKWNKNWWMICMLGIAAAAFACGMASYDRGDLPLNMVKMALMFCVLSITLVTDITLCLIPNACVAVLIIGRMATVAWEAVAFREAATLGWMNSLIAGGFSVAFLYIVSRITHGGIGYGDVKLFAALGFLCGIRGLLYTFALALLFCSLVAVFLLVTKRKNMKDGVPFAPFIWAGFALTVFLGLC